MPEKDLKRALQSLAMGKSAQRVLSRKGHGKDIGMFGFCLLILQFLFACLTYVHVQLMFNELILQSSLQRTLTNSL